MEVGVCLMGEGKKGQYMLANSNHITTFNIRVGQYVRILTDADRDVL